MQHFNSLLILKALFIICIDVCITQVTLVGLVRSVKESSTCITYEIDDMSGPSIDVRQFVDNDVCMMSKGQSYCSIFKPYICNQGGHIHEKNP